MNNNYEIDKSRVQQFGLTATVKDDSGNEHYFYRGHEYIEIGGLKWAVSNIGAEKETDGGLYFAFGETKGYTAEQVRSGEKRLDKKGYANANFDFDAVNVYWGGKWRLPTADEFRVLLTSATHEWVKDYEGSGVSGRLFTDKADRSKKLFFPAVGFCDYGGAYRVGCAGHYWSSTLNTDAVVNYGRSLSFYDVACYMEYYACFLGFSIRGVVGE